MAGFGSIIGFMFSFFIIIAVFFGTFYTYQSQVEYQTKALESFEKQQLEGYNFNVDFSDPLYLSDKLTFNILNNGNSPLVYKEKYSECFDLYVNGKYISKDNFLTYYESPKDNYYILMPRQTGVLDVVVDINSSEDNNIKIISCDGNEAKYVLDSGDIGWLDTNRIRRSTFTVVNSGAQDDQDEIYVIELNASNFDFTKANEEDILLLVPTYENLILDVNFNDYKQTLDDFSRYSNTLYLGSNNGVEGIDPANAEGAVFDGIDLDGIDDYSGIVSDAILQPQKEITLSAWVNIDDWTGDAKYPIIDLGGSKISVMNGGGNDKELEFSLGVGTIYSSNTLNNDTWYHVVSTYNGSVMKIYIDSQEVFSNPDLGDMTYSGSYYIGRDNSANYFNGLIDDVKVYNVALNSSEVVDLYKNRFISRELNFSVIDWSSVGKSANLSVEMPIVVRNNENITFELYYYYAQGETSQVVGEPPAVTYEPDQISDLGGTFGNEEVYLTWSEPNDNGYPITSYTVEYGIGAAFDQTFVDDATPGATITGLTNDVEWQFRVFATNSEGDGVASSALPLTPSGTWWLRADSSTNLGVDGTANQGTTPVAYAEMMNTTSADTSACIGERATMVNRIIGQEYTQPYPAQTEIQASVTGQISVDGSSTSTTWVATLYEYNDGTGDVVTLGTASAISSVSGPDTLALTFNNTAFNVTSGNRLKVVFDATNGGNKNTYLCYGVGTQSYLTFDRN